VRPAFDQHRSRPLSRSHVGPRPTREDMHEQRACPRRRIGDLNLMDRCVGPDTSVRMHRTAGACETGAPVQSDQIRCARTRCVGPLEMPLGLVGEASGYRWKKMGSPSEMKRLLICYLKAVGGKYMKFHKIRLLETGFCYASELIQKNSYYKANER
jgi:hypothetical protein